MRDSIDKTMGNPQLPSFRIADIDGLPPACPSGDDPTVEAWLNQDGSVWGCNCISDGVHWIHLPGQATFRFEADSREVTAVCLPQTDPGKIAETYFRQVQPYVLAALGQEVLHASAVRGPHGVVAVCGHSMAGKSTVAYGLSQRGHPIWADDLVAFKSENGRLLALPLPFEVRLRPPSARFFGQEAGVAAVSSPTAARGGEEGPVPIAGLCLLKRARESGIDRAVCMTRLAPAQALPAVLDVAFYFALYEIERKRRMLQHYLRLTEQVPVFEIRFQAGLDMLPIILDNVEQVLNLSGPAPTIG